MIMISTEYFSYHQSSYYGTRVRCSHRDEEILILIPSLIFHFFLTNRMEFGDGHRRMLPLILEIRGVHC